MNETYPRVPEAVTAEWIILADHAEVINNKLYLMGGGWDSLTVPAVPHEYRLALAVAFSVPWNETNRQHNIEIEVSDQDGASLVKIEGQIEVGRPPGIPVGHTQRIQMGVSLGTTLKSLGTYEVSAGVQGGERRRTTFNVVAIPNYQPRQPG